MGATVSLGLDDATAARLRALSATRHRPTEDLVQQAIVEFLEREEGLAEDAARWQGYSETGGAIDHDIGAERLDRLEARRRRGADLLAGAAGDLGHPDDDTARDAARRAFRALSRRA